MFSLPKKA